VADGHAAGTTCAFKNCFLSGHPLDFKNLSFESTDYCKGILWPILMVLKCYYGFILCVLYINYYILGLPILITENFGGGEKIYFLFSKPCNNAVNTDWSTSRLRLATVDIQL